MINDQPADKRRTESQAMVRPTAWTERLANCVTASSVSGKLSGGDGATRQ